MIIFCEDCGEKNDLDPSDLASGRADFKCIRCGYGNSFPVKMPEKGSAAGGFLEKILSFSEIIGAFFFHRTNGVVAWRMPGRLTLDDLGYLGAGLADSYEAGVSCDSGIRAMTTVISDKHLRVHRIGEYGYLVVISASGSLPDSVSEYIAALEQGAENG